MANTIQIKRSTGTAAPSSLSVGELAYTNGTGTGSNLGDRLFIGDGSAVTVIGGQYFSDMLDQTAGVLTASSAVLIDSNKRIDTLNVGNNSTNGGTIHFLEGTTNGNHYVSVAGPNSISSNVTLTLPEATDTLVGKATTDTLTNKSVNLTNNTLTGTLAQFNTALSDDDFVSLTGTETLTNKTFTSPTINTPTIGTSLTIGSAIMSETDLEKLDDITNGTVTASKALVVDANKDIGTLRNLTIDGIFTDGNYTFDTSGNVSGLGTVSSGAITSSGSITAGTSLIIGSADINETDLEKLDGITNGTVAASKALVVDANKDISTLRNVTLNGTLVAEIVTVNNLTLDGNTITSTNTNGDIGLSPNGSGVIDVNTSIIRNVTDPTQAQDAATKSYVDAVKTGLDIKDSVDIATTAALDASTYNNGTAGVGATLTASANGAINSSTGLGQSITLVVGSRVLVKDQSSGLQNGIYKVTTVGDGSTVWALTRVTDADSNNEITGGSFTFVEKGTNADNGYVFTHLGTPTMGTTSLTVAQFSGAGQIVAGAGLTKSANTLNAVGTAGKITISADAITIASSYVGQNTITTLGTIGTGVWEATDVAVAHGGTGVSTLTSKGIVFGNGASALNVTAAGTWDSTNSIGQILSVNSSGTPVWTNTIDGGTF